MEFLLTLSHGILVDDRPELISCNHGLLVARLNLQEAGRAGRDGLPAECTIFFREQVHAHHHMTLV